MDKFALFFSRAIPISSLTEVIDSTMPQILKNIYPSTGITDYTELFCLRPSSLSIQSCMYWHCKSHVTYKGLLGIDPSESISFINHLYDRSISDKEIVRRSGISDERFWQPNDNVIADRGFKIDEGLIFRSSKLIGIKLSSIFLRRHCSISFSETSVAMLDFIVTSNVGLFTILPCPASFS